MKEQIKTMWKEICANFHWRLSMQLDRKIGRGEIIDTCRTIVFENVNIIVSWFGSYGQIRYLNNKYPNINFVYPISNTEFLNLISLYEQNELDFERLKEMELLKNLRLKYPHI